ncbi:DUF349 domain-containing protein [Corynebacterium uberis]|uniref:DUF349 domain-containing protein n=2 Tax=Corynebacterium TaxID=1716 RepID=UPI003D16060E
MTDKPTSDHTDSAPAAPTRRAVPNPAMLAKKRPAVARTGANAAPLAPLPPNDPSQWGRVDEDGTVWVRTETGERPIGQWQAGSPDEALAHYGARYDDLSTEVALLESRLAAHPDDAPKIRHAATELKEGLPVAAVIGDLSVLRTRLDAIIERADDAHEAFLAERTRHREEATARKTALAEEAERLAKADGEWKATGDRFKEIFDEWRTIHGVDRKTDDALWKRFSHSRETFNRRRGSHFAELDRNRAAVKKRKEELIEQAQGLQDSTDWGPTAREFKALMTQWKAAGRASRDVDDRLWEKFRAAQDHFFDARNAAHQAQEDEYVANARAKDELLAEYSPLIDPETNLDAARTKLAELQEKWDEIGFVPRGQVKAYENKIAELENNVAAAEKAQWRRTDPQAQARAAQFTAKVEEFTQAAEAAGKHNKATQLREQAAQWQEWADAAQSAVADR